MVFCIQKCLTFFITFYLFHFVDSLGLTPCLDETGLTYLPSATSCSNELDDAICIEIFAAADHTPGAVVIDSDCTTPGMTRVTMECANRCGMCCQRKEYACGDSESKRFKIAGKKLKLRKASPINCQANIAKCRDPAWSTVMTTYCHGTCGTCLNRTCIDLNDRCIDMVAICNHVIFRNFMAARCAFTCDRCTTTAASVTTTALPSSSLLTCSDNTVNCASNIALCNNPMYFNLMTQKCPRTCNRCSNSISTVNSTCTDTNPNCASWVRNGFCSNSFYTAAQKRQYCGRSCNLC